jgi:FMN phosphatase YigB (HAD superfamily)
MNKVAFFDWTGTLADESALDKAVCKSMEEDFARNNNVDIRIAEETFRKHLQKLENTWEWHNYILHGEALGVDWKSNQEKNFGKLKLLPYAREILEYTRNKDYKNVLATNAIRPVIELRVEHVGLTNLFDLLVGSDDAKALKSQGKHFEYASKFIEYDPKLSYSVGDNPVQDILPAKNIGMNTIYCDFKKNLTYYHTDHISENHKEIANSDHTISSLIEIKDIIK